MEPIDSSSVLSLRGRGDWSCSWLLLPRCGRWFLCSQSLTSRALEKEGCRFPQSCRHPAFHTDYSTLSPRQSGTLTCFGIEMWAQGNIGRTSTSPALLLFSFVLQELHVLHRDCFSSRALEWETQQNCRHRLPWVANTWQERHKCLLLLVTEVFVVVVVTAAKPSSPKTITLHLLKIPPRTNEACAMDPSPSSLLYCCHQSLLQSLVIIILYSFSYSQLPELYKLRPLQT